MHAFDFIAIIAQLFYTGTHFVIVSRSVARSCINRAKRIGAFYRIEQKGHYSTWRTGYAVLYQRLFFNYFFFWWSFKNGADIHFIDLLHICDFLHCNLIYLIKILYYCCLTGQLNRRISKGFSFHVKVCILSALNVAISKVIFSVFRWQSNNFWVRATPNAWSVINKRVRLDDLTVQCVCFHVPACKCALLNEPSISKEPCVQHAVSIMSLHHTMR